jgi:hypothetical protein
MVNAPTNSFRDYRTASYRARAASVAGGAFTPSEERTLREKGYTARYLKSLSPQEIRNLAARESLPVSTIPTEKIGIDSNNIVTSNISNQVAIRGDASNNVVRSSFGSVGVNSSLAQPTQSSINPNNPLNFGANSSRNVTIGGGVAQKLAREGDNPQTIRGDINYTVQAGVRQRTKPLQQSVDLQAQEKVTESKRLSAKQNRIQSILENEQS